ncbi:MAG: integrase/recombinase XerD [Frankiales bacterium]|nr:integrase/recombinase XerD [Frankiales bacterium]
MITQYLDETRALGLRPNSAAVRRRVLAGLALGLVPTGLLEATPEQLLAWLIHTPDWSLATRQAYRSHLVAFYSWAARRGYIAMDPSIDLPQVKVPRRLPRPLAAGEVTRALSIAKSPQMIAMIALAAFAGLRCFEIAAVRGEDVQLGAIARLRIPEQKGGDEAMVPAHPVIVEAAKSLPPRGWWFPRQDGRGHVHASVITNQGSAFLRAIGIDATMHQLRHSFGTQLYEQTGDLRVVQELMRHRSPTSTALYTEVSDTRRATVLQQLAYAAAPVAS